jgi:hypothetical protein
MKWCGTVERGKKEKSRSFAALGMTFFVVRPAEAGGKMPTADGGPYKCWGNTE